MSLRFFMLVQQAVSEFCYPKLAQKLCVGICVSGAFNTDHQFLHVKLRMPWKCPNCKHVARMFARGGKPGAECSSGSGLWGMWQERGVSVEWRGRSP